jgi:lantibiotic modifying enzyme
LPPADRLGFHSGIVGVAWAAAHIATILAHEGLLAQAGAVTRTLLDGKLGGGRHHDIVSGNAGTILGLLALRPLMDDSALLDQAVRQGDALLAAAESSRTGWSWPMAANREGRAITGLAHGAAGVGLALLELYAATGVDAYRDGAAAAFAFEQAWFDDTAGNWQDLRVSRRRGDRASFATAWCHGAPGIAVARLRAHTLVGDERAGGEALRALGTTWRYLSAQLGCPGVHLSLCHGLLGNAMVLAYGASVLGAAAATLPTADRLRPRVADHLGLASGYSPRDGPAAVDPQERDWSRRDLGLMTGEAGVAYYAVRQLDPSLPCPLTICPRPGDQPAQ